MEVVRKVFAHFLLVPAKAFRDVAVFRESLADFFADSLETMDEFLKALSESAGTSFPEEYRYLSGNPAGIRRRILEVKTGSVDTNVEALLEFGLCGLTFGTVRAQKGQKDGQENKYTPEGLALLELGQKAWQKINEAESLRSIGVTPSAVIASMPELSLILMAVQPNRPAPGILQMPLIDSVREELDKRFTDMIGPDKSGKDDISASAGDGWPNDFDALVDGSISSWCGNRPIRRANDLARPW